VENGPLVAQLTKLGRSMEGATIVEHGWKADEYGLMLAWKDCFCAFVGFGTLGTAVIESTVERAH
jgi:hypothetical protein